MLQLKKLTLSVENKEILKDLNLTINPGEVHAIMGPNGTGKSTLAKAIAGDDEISVKGDILYKNKKINELSCNERSNQGIFLSFQNPIEIAGVNNLYFLKEILNQKKEYQKEVKIDSPTFIKEVKEYLKFLEMDSAILSRSLNSGFSGGEKKKNEILQMLVLKPELLILDEIDSGLDIDALKIVAKGVNSLRDKNRSFLLITHYKRLLEYIEPDFVHILKNKQIVKTGDKSLVDELEEKGYQGFGENKI